MKIINSTQEKNLENLIMKIPNLIGSTRSIIVHTLMFVSIYSLRFFNWDLDSINLILTTIVSLEAIYLSIFIQLSVNQNKRDIIKVKEEIVDIDNDLNEITTNSNVIANEHQLKLNVEKLQNEIANLNITISKMLQTQ